MNSSDSEVDNDVLEEFTSLQGMIKNEEISEGEIEKEVRNIFRSDYKDEKAEKKPTSRKRRSRESGFLNCGSMFHADFGSIGSIMFKHFNPKRARSTLSDATSRRTTSAGIGDVLQPIQSPLQSEPKSTRTELEAELRIVQAELKILQDKLQGVEAKQEIITLVIEKLAPGLLQSLMQQQSSTLPPPSV